MPSRESPEAQAAQRTKPQPFIYPAMPSGESPRPAELKASAAANGASPARSLWANLQAQGRDRLTYSEEELQTRVSGLEAKSRESEEKLRNEYEAALVRERATVAEALRQFDGQRKSYFERVEAEVVQLALAVARKILHREAQADPLVLAGTIRVALEKVAAGSRVKLIVPDHDVFKWRQVMGTALKNVQPHAEVVGDPALAPGCCILETEVGSSQISLDHQFREVERGLLDLLAVRAAS